MRRIRNKQIIIFDIAMIVGTLLIMAGLYGYYDYTKPVLLSPEDDLITKDTNVLFEFEKAGVILIDDNLDFTSPEKIYAEDNLVINLKPGIYYWKLEGVLSSEIRKLTIQSEVDLKLRESSDGDNYEIVNAGNTKLNVDIYENEEYKESIKVGVDESKEVSGTKFIGEQEDENE